MSQKYRTSYPLNEALLGFFTIVSNDKELQAKLYKTNNLSEVADEAVKRGFSIKACDILHAQAGRALATLEDEPENAALLLSAEKSRTGAQWGRNCGGYLDAAGYWLLTLFIQGETLESPVEITLGKLTKNAALCQTILRCPSFNDVAKMLTQHDYHHTAEELLQYQATVILNLPNEIAQKVADGKRED